jgi:hypothetical protein
LKILLKILEKKIQKIKKIKKKGKEKEKTVKKNKESEKEDIANEVDIKNIYVFNFIEFVEYYKEHLRALINREQEDDKEIFTKVKTQIFKTYKRNGYFLSNKILEIYMNISNNNYKKFMELFKLIKCVKNSDENINKINDNKHVNVIEEGNDDKNILSELIMNKNMNKLEKDLKIFGSYEFVDITDVIERHFIIERCFTSYGLIKFSLLNILAITRGFENQKISNPKVMTTICDFCNKTKSLARKYMNIFLNILQELNFKNIIKNKKEFQKCRSIIAKYFTKSNMLPTEETTKAFNEKQKGDIDKNEKDEIEINENIDENKDKEEKKYISEHGKFFDEKNKKKKFDEMLKIIEAIFTGNYSSKTGINTITYKELNTSYDKNRKDAKPKDNFIPKTPLILYYSSKELLAKYINNQYEINKANYDELLSDILSLIFYFKIPVIGEKWIEHYKTEKEKIAQEKNLTKKNAKINIENDLIELKQIISIIIAILVDLIDVILKDSKK